MTVEVDVGWGRGLDSSVDASPSIATTTTATSSSSGTGAPMRSFFYRKIHVIFHRASQNENFSNGKSSKSGMRVTRRLKVLFRRRGRSALAGGGSKQLQVHNTMLSNMYCGRG